MKKVISILNKNGYIYEKTPSGNIVAEPMIGKVSEKVLAEIQKSGYWSVISCGRILVFKSLSLKHTKPLKRNVLK